MHRFISWSKFLDPLERTDSDIELIPEKDVTEFDNNPDAVFEKERQQIGEDEGIEEPNPVIICPLGVISIKALNARSKAFNFWLGETNFDLTEEAVHILNDVPGVEILDIFTRYKFRVSIGNNFKFQEVRQSIEKALDAVPPPKTKVVEHVENMELDDDTTYKVKQIIKLQLAQSPYWALYVCPNGAIDMVASEEKTTEFDHKLELYESSRKLAGGAVFTFNEPPI